MGPIAELSATLGFRRKTALIADTGEKAPITAPDVAMIDGTLESGVPFSLAFRGGPPRGTGLIWDIHGTGGDLRISGGIGLPEMVPLELSGGRGEGALQPIALPDAYVADMTDGPVAGNVRRVYAAMASDLRHGTKMAPTFDYAVTMHQIIEAIERSAQTGQRLRPADM
jgi:predicted dehydrogenase